MRRCPSSSSGKAMPRDTLLGLWRHWAGRLDDRARAGIVDSRGSVLVLKRRLYSKSWIKEKENRMLQQPLRPGRLREKYVVIRVTDCYDARESMRHVLGVENRG